MISNPSDPVTEAAARWNESQTRLIEAERRMAQESGLLGAAGPNRMDELRAEVLLLRRKTDELFAVMMQALAAQRQSFRNSRP